MLEAALDYKLLEGTSHRPGTQWLCMEHFILDSLIYKDTFLATFSETEAIDDNCILETTLGDTLDMQVFLILELTRNYESITIKFALLCIKWITFIEKNMYIQIGVTSEN